MGDFFLGSLSGSTFSPKIGVETTGQNFTMNGSGNTTGYTTPLAAGELVTLSGSVTTTSATTGTTSSPQGWETGLTNWNNVPAPSQIATSGYTVNTITSATIAYEQLGNGPHYIYQATITNFAALGLGNDFTVHWGEICGNDWLRTTTADVPLPSSLALFLLGGAGLAAVTEEQSTMIAADEVMKPLMAMADKVAPSDATILITGESGTGKEVMSQYIHRKSKRAGGPFIAVNCSAFPETLLDSELFGHARGAFTGAHAAHVGL
jgi:hypothetical protein